MLFLLSPNILRIFPYFLIGIAPFKSKFSSLTKVDKRGACFVVGDVISKKKEKKKEDGNFLNFGNNVKK
jgi:hypothetical protein